jgi:3-hydroxymyristoyl/3-hydroxydecanoyl-(acyl carrier protein) dehydratase
MHAEFIISSTHPALDGHFPDNPVVPGVVILDQVTRLWQDSPEHHNDAIREILNSKFVQLLKPDMPCQIHYTENKLGKVSFSVTSQQGKIIASGMFSYESKQQS